MVVSEACRGRSLGCGKRQHWHTHASSMKYISLACCYDNGMCFPWIGGVQSQIAFLNQIRLSFCSAKICRYDLVGGEARQFGRHQQNLQQNLRRLTLKIPPVSRIHYSICCLMSDPGKLRSPCLCGCQNHNLRAEPQRDEISSERKSSRRVHPTFLLQSEAPESQNKVVPKTSDKCDLWN